MAEALYQIRHVEGATHIGIFHPDSGVSVTIEHPYGASTEQLADLVEGLPEILIRIGEELAGEHLPPVADSPRRRASDWERAGHALVI